MTVTSMTGFARVDGASGSSRWSWEIKTVNSKTLDLRLRLPPGFDRVEVAARAAIAGTFARGACQASLTVKRDAPAVVVRINQPVLDAVVEAMAQAARHIDAAAPRLDGLFAIKGVIETEEPEETEAERTTLHADVVGGLERALIACAAARREEGQAIGRVLLARTDEIEALAAEAEANPARQPAAIRERLAQQVRALVETGAGLDADRLHQEAILLATKADIREELDRLQAHVAAARGLLAAEGAVGRRLDFLAQEFNREVNTLCAKSNDVGLTTTGLSLKAVVEQFREQVQNIE